MAYTLYLYKEFPSKSNKTIRLEIFQKDYVGSAIEIEELAGNPIILNTDNSANDIDVPIIKTSLSINIIDTNQFDYSIFFTPDATKFKVIVKVSGTPEWTGFLTPDSFVQSESYRSSISLIARDNIGMLAEFEYDGTQLPVKINTTINNAFTKINFGGVLEYRVKKLDNAGVNILNDIVNGKLFVGRNYYEVVEILLRGIGCQLRYVGGNKYAIFDIADLKGYGDTLTAQTFLFIEQSGAVEIVPARKSIKITQDYGLQESIYDGPIPTEDFSFIEQRNAGLQYLTYRLPRPPVPAEQQDFYVNYYNIPIGARWVSTMALLEPTYFQRPESSILITGTNTESIVGLGKLMYSRAIPETNRDTNLKITVDVSKLIYGVGKYQRIGDELALWDMRIGTSNSKLHFRCNFFFDDGTTIQYLSSGGWREKPLDYADRFDIVLEQVEDESSTDTPYQTLEFNLGNADSAGTLTMEIYPYWLENNTLSLNVSAYVMELRDFDIKFVRLDEKIGGVESVGVINNDYNLAAEVNLSIGQVPNYLGNNLTMLAGIFQDASYYPPAFDFHRPSGTNYKLFELIGREIAHHYKTQKNKLSGTIINSTNFAAMPSFGKTFTDGVKNYALNYGALDFRNETMQVELIEVEDYVTESYTFVEAEVESGGGSMGSGENEYIQWSNAGNVKRIYELDTASEADQGGSYVMIDKSGLSAAKKVPISSLLVDAYTKTESDSRFASIDGDLTQDFSAKKLTTATLLLPQTAPILASGEAAIYSLDSGFSGELPSGAGSVTSISMLVPTGLSVTPNTITESGTFTISYASGYSIPTNTKQSEWNSAYNDKINSATFTASTLTLAQQDGGTIAVSVPTFNQNTTGSAATLTTPRAINVSVSGVSGTAQNFNGSAAITIPVTLTTLTRGNYLTGSNYNGGTATTWAVDATTTATANKVVARDANADIFVRDVNASRKVKGATLILPQSAPILDSGEVGIYSLDSGFSGELPSGSGSVTSIALTMPTGFSVSGSPITESGTFGVTFASGYFLPTTTQFASKLDVSLKGSPNGLAELDENGFVKNTQLPSYVDDVLEYNNLAAFPATGESGKIYIAKDTNKTYRWGGTGYVVISETLALGETSSTAYRGDRGKIAYDHTFLTNNPHSVTFAQLLSKPNTISGYGIDMEGGVDWSTVLNSSTIGFLSGATNAPIAGSTHYGIGMRLAGYPAYSGVFVVRNNRAFFQTKESNNLQGWKEFYHSGNSNLTSIDWSAKNLTLAGSISGATTITANGTISGSTFKFGSNYIGSIGQYLYLQTTGNEMCIGGATNMYINYREANGGTPTSYIWRAGTSTSWADFLIGNLTANGTIQATTAKLTNLTDGYIPYHISDASGLGNSVIRQSGTTINVGGALTIAGALSGVTTLSASGIASLTNTTQSTAYTNGALVLSGGLGIAKDLYSNGKGSFNTLIIPQVAPTLSSGEMAIYGLESGFSGEMPSGAGSVTSISMVVPTGLSVTPATITESGTFTISYASGYQMMTSTESSKLAGIEANANNYTLPTATNLVLGGVKIGSNITITDGVISVAAPYTLPTATASVLGGVKIGTNVTITDGVISVHNPVTLGTANGLSLSTQALSLGLASTSTNGALSSDDWNTFNNKQAKLIGTGASSLVRVNTLGAITYDNNTYLTGNQTITLSGIITGSGTTAITTAIADGALSIAKTNGLQTALDGKLSTTGKAADSDKLDGQDSTYFATAASLGVLTTNYLPYWNGTSLADSPLRVGSGKVGINRAATNSALSISGGNSYSYAALDIIVENPTTYNWASRSVCAMTTGQNIEHLFGVANSTNNLGYIGFNYAGSGLIGNAIIFGFYSNDNLVKIFASGNVAIGFTTNQSEKFTVNGSGRFATTLQMAENINTNLRIPKVAPTSPTSGEYYFYIVE